MKRKLHKGLHRNKKGVIILNGIKYLLIVTIVLLAIAFVATKLLHKSDDGEIEQQGGSQTVSSVTDAGTVSETQVSGSGITESTDSTAKEEPDVNIDNEWAMFLVNNDNPLPENYDEIIKTSLVYSSYRDYYMDSRMTSYMTDMIEAAKEDGIDLVVVSAYRTSAYQQQNFDSSLNDRINSGMTYDEAYKDTTASVAFPGKSEHNAGLAADIMSEEYTSMDDDGFKNTKAFKWLDEHSAEYGFILRYPENKSDYTGIIYEPWHYRFVGVYYANEIKKGGYCLEEYFEKNGWLDESGKATQCLGPVEAEKPAQPSSNEEQTQVTTVPQEQPTQKVSIIV